MKVRMMLLGIFMGVLAVGNALANEGVEVGKEADEVMPASVSGIWGEVKEHEAMLKKTIEAGELDKVHLGAFKIRDMVKALSEKSAILAPDNLENVKSGSGRMAEIADQLDKYGDAGDNARTKEQFQRLTKVLDFIQSQYPPAELGADEHKEEDVAKDKN